MKLRLEIVNEFIGLMCSSEMTILALVVLGEVRFLSDLDISSFNSKTRKRFMSIFGFWFLELGVERCRFVYLFLHLYILQYTLYQIFQN